MKHTYKEEEYRMIWIHKSFFLKFYLLQYPLQLTVHLIDLSLLLHFLLRCNHEMLPTLKTEGSSPTFKLTNVISSLHTKLQSHISVMYKLLF